MSSTVNIVGSWVLTVFVIIGSLVWIASRDVQERFQATPTCFVDVEVNRKVFRASKKYIQFNCEGRAFALKTE